MLIAAEPLCSYLQLRLTGDMTHDTAAAKFGAFMLLKVAGDGNRTQAWQLWARAPTAVDPGSPIISPFYHLVLQNNSQRSAAGKARF